MRITIPEEKINKIKKVMELSYIRRSLYQNQEGLESVIQSDAYNKAEERLTDYMDELSFEDIKFIQAIMYLGRDTSLEEKAKQSATELLKSQLEYLGRNGWTTKEGETDHVQSKMPLDEYLKEGLSITSILY
ncbi:DUF3775 domain-containing protein [Sporosarcina sp. P1]|uniref:DUF3775 domain-containing protein n=1 Tax=Sporosarcina sp. P1 TaxID=2048257 RepID=UPI000C170357|nr:DUF3775 domain-containing protein [Sporosarcina sp. P1]PIC82093.1 hypothetical protein CSV73_14295 [Sporosarcina sp. P1]